MGSLETFSNFIDGEHCAPVSGKYFDNYNPSTGVVDSRLPDSDAKDVAGAVSSAKLALPAWKAMPLRHRCEIFEKIARILDERCDEFASAESRDQGKPVHLAASVDIPRAALNFRYFAGHMTHRLEQATHTSQGALNYTTRSALGVAALISPWNLPLYLLTWKIAPALITGNTAVCKPSEMTSRTANMMGEVFQQAGLPKGVCNIVLGKGSSAGQALVSHPEVALISFTGGTVTGRKIAELAAPSFKKTSLELGGKNATIVFEDANIKEAIPMLVRSAFLNQGEICLCGSRIYVHESRYGEFVDGFVAKVKKLRIGDPCSKMTFMGPLVSKEHLEKVKSYVEVARKEGAEILCGGESPLLKAPFDGGYFFSPTVITSVDSKSCLQREEIFGPVVTISPFSSEEEVIEKANSTEYGLSASVWTEQSSRAYRVAENLDVGTVWVNTWMLRDLRMPFGGMKNSGMGREGADHSIDFFTEVKTVCLKV